MRSVVNRLYNSPLALLLGTGALLGLNFPFGKLAMAEAIAPSLWASVISLGAGVALLIIAKVSEPPPERTTGLARFAIISGFISYVMPNLLIFTVIPKIGSGMAGIMFALSPVATAMLSLLLNVRPPNRFGVLGISLGLLGAALIVWGKSRGVGQGVSLWLLLALAVPLFLAVGNVYRSLAWPQGVGPKLLGSLTNLASVPFLIAIALVLGDSLNPSVLMHRPILLLAQLAASTATFTMFFRLQQIGGPTYLSQIGYVAAAVSLFIGVGVFGEYYPAAVWIGAAIIVVGIGLATYSTRRPE